MEQHEHSESKLKPAILAASLLMTQPLFDAEAQKPKIENKQETYPLSIDPFKKQLLRDGTIVEVIDSDVPKHTGFKEYDVILTSAENERNIEKFITNSKDIAGNLIRGIILVHNVEIISHDAFSFRINLIRLYTLLATKATLEPKHAEDYAQMSQFVIKAIKQQDVFIEYLMQQHNKKNQT